MFRSFLARDTGGTTAAKVEDAESHNDPRSS